jgi:hypothetical protein
MPKIDRQRVNSIVDILVFTIGPKQMITGESVSQIMQSRKSFSITQPSGNGCVASNEK